jgi:hypothetical protein
MKSYRDAPSDFSRGEKLIFSLNLRERENDRIKDYFQSFGKHRNINGESSSDSQKLFSFFFDSLLPVIDYS